MKSKRIIEEEIDELIDEIVSKSYERTKKETLKSRFVRYINNAETPEEKEYILTILKNVVWHWSIQIDDFIISKICELLSEDTIVLDYLSVTKRESYSSSAQRLYTNLVNIGYVADTDVIKIEDITKLNTETQNIILLDDFIGSGTTIEKVLKTIEDRVAEKKIYIICYACHVKGKTLLEHYPMKNRNQVELIYNNIENSYINIIKETDVIEYIEKICNRCAKKELRFGWENCGSIVSINGTSPNNNISMLYSHYIKNWDSLLDRDINIEILNKKKKEVCKNRINEIYKFYFTRNFSDIITKEEFMLLVLIFNCYGIDVNTLKLFECCSTESELEDMIRKLEEKSIVEIVKGYIMIINRDILKALKELDEKLKCNYTKKAGHHFC